MTAASNNSPNWSSRFGNIAKAKPKNDFQNALPIGTHKLALVGFTVKQVGKVKYDLVESSWRILETTAQDAQVGEVRTWAWHVGAPGDFNGEYEMARNQAFLTNVRDNLELEAEHTYVLDEREEWQLVRYTDDAGNTEDAEGNPILGPMHIMDVGSAMAEGQLTGFVIEAEVYGKNDKKTGKPLIRKGTANTPITQINWNPIAQTIDDMTEMATFLESAPKVEQKAAVAPKIASPAAAPAPAPAPAQKPAAPAPAPAGNSLAGRLKIGVKK